MYTCPECNNKFHIFSDLGSHFKHDHQKDPKELDHFVCCQCSEVFKRTILLKKHIREKHSGPKRKMSIIMCQLCTKRSQNDKELKEHLAKDHDLEIQCEKVEFENLPLIKGNEPSNEPCNEPSTKPQNSEHNSQKRNKSHLLCPLCTENTKSQKGLINHLVQDHDLDIECEKFDFDNIEDFKSWKTAKERDLNVMYVKQTAGKRLVSGEIRSYYHCHRSHSARPVGLELRRQKAIGSNKIERACPAGLHVTEVGGKVSVLHYATHVGHTFDIGRMNLSSEDKTFLVDKLRKGLTIDEILAEIRESATKSNFNRLHLLNKKDIHNLIRDFSIPVQKATKPTPKRRNPNPLFDQVVDAHRRNAPLKLDKIKLAHEESKRLPGCKFDPEREGWLVEECFIKKLPNTCRNQKVCAEKCEVCDICIHSYRCTCADNKLFLNICKHIHAVHSKMDIVDGQRDDDSQEGGAAGCDLPEEDEIADCITHLKKFVKEEFFDRQEKEKEINDIIIENIEDQPGSIADHDVKAKLELIKRLYANVELKESETDQVVSHLNSVISLLSKNFFKDHNDFDDGTFIYIE